MDKEGQEHVDFLEQQLKWCKKQDRILEEIEMKLHDMKKLAEYAHDYELTEIEIDKLNSQLNELKNVVSILENSYILLFIRL